MQRMLKALEIPLVSLASVLIVVVVGESSGIVGNTLLALAKQRAALDSVWARLPAVAAEILTQVVPLVSLLAMLNLVVVTLILAWIAVMMAAKIRATYASQWHTGGDFALGIFMGNICLFVVAMISERYGDSARAFPGVIISFNVGSEYVMNDSMNRTTLLFFSVVVNAAIWIYADIEHDKLTPWKMRRL